MYEIMKRINGGKWRGIMGVVVCVLLLRLFHTPPASPSESQTKVLAVGKRMKPTLSKAKKKAICRCDLPRVQVAKICFRLVPSC